jgi:LEA14-like dessication related protein
MGYAVRLNDVTLVDDTERGVGFGTGRSTVDVSAAMANERIADWWVAHVNDGESSTLSVDATVSAPGLSQSVPVRESTVETDLLEGFTSTGSRTVSLEGDPFLVVSDERASWGEATAERTPIRFSSRLENVHDYAVTLDGIAYEVTMNDVRLGQARTDDAFALDPGQGGAFDVTVALDTPKMAAWWREHVRDGEESEMTVAMYGLVERDGELVRVPLRLFEKSLRMETDMLGDGETSVESLEDDSTADASGVKPAVAATEQSWGQVTDARTDVDTTVTLETPDGEFADVLALDLTQSTAINDVTVATGGASADGLARGSDSLAYTVAMDNGEVPTWWARHLNRGERSSVVTTPTATVDAGITTVEADLDTRRSTFETDLLAGLRDGGGERVRADGRPVLTVTDVSASWGRATPSEAPIDVTARIQNEFKGPLTIESVDYTVSTNGITLADRTDRIGQTIRTGRTEEVPVRMRLDNSRMDAWWVSHVRNDERSSFDVDAEVTVSSVGFRRTEPLDSLSQSSTVETDVLNRTDE